MRDRRLIFWDFDGVIKESVDVKTRAFVELFASHGEALAARIRRHHERNGGMSRYEKIPLYLQWAGYASTPARIDDLCARFSQSVRGAVVASDWVPGAYEYLEANWRRQCFVLITATPQEEMREILEALNIGPWFQEVYGSPTQKSAAVASVLAQRRCMPGDALLIGDSWSDYHAAQQANVEFLLRRTPLNVDLQQRHAGRQCEDFRNG